MLLSQPFLICSLNNRTTRVIINICTFEWICIGIIIITFNLILREIANKHVFQTSKFMTALKANQRRRQTIKR